MDKLIVLDTCAFPWNVKKDDKKFDVDKYKLIFSDTRNRLYITPFTLLELTLDKNNSIEDIAISLCENNINILSYENIIFTSNSMTEIQNNIEKIYQVTFLYIKKFVVNLIENYLLNLLMDKSPELFIEIDNKIRAMFDEIRLEIIKFKEFINNDFIGESFSKVLVLLEKYLHKEYTWESFRNVIFSPKKNSINDVFIKCETEYRTFLTYLQEDCYNKPKKLINNVIDYLNLHSCIQFNEKFMFITRDRKLYKHANDMREKLNVDVEILDTFTSVISQ